MCGGAIIADLIPAKRCSLPAKKRPWRDVDVDDDDFEAAFEEFEGDSEEDGEYETVAMNDDDENEALLLLLGNKLVPPLFPRERHANLPSSSPPHHRKRRRANASVAGTLSSPSTNYTMANAPACASNDGAPAVIGEELFSAAKLTAGDATIMALPHADAASWSTGEPEVVDPYDFYGELSSFFTGGEYEPLESLFAGGVAADEHGLMGMWSFGEEDGSFYL